MNAPYETVNNMARAICGMKPAAIIQPNDQTVVGRGTYYPYQFNSANGLAIDCLLEYTRAHDGGTGPNSDESYPESISLIYALINGVDISEVLCDEVKSLIEEEALCSMEMDAWNDAADQEAA
jgi:hypothetical protein